MAYLLTHPETQVDPAEYESSTPVVCRTCGRTWDRDDDFETLYKEIEGDVYCAFADGHGHRSCASRKTEEVMRTAIAEEVIDRLNATLLAIEQEESIHDEYVDCPDHPSAMIEELLARLKAWGAGRDSQWRPSGIQLPLTIDAVTEAA